MCAVLPTGGFPARVGALFLTRRAQRAILRGERHLIRRLLTIIALCALALGAPAGARAADSVTITDPSDDAGGAPDIIKMVVTDDVAGSFTFTVELATMPDLQPDGLLVVFLDTDRNDTTGRNGVEFYVSATPKGVALARWTGSAWEIVPDANLQLRLTGSGVQFELPQALVGTTHFDAFAGATRESTNAVDAAPDDGALAFPPRIDRFLIAAAILSPRAGGVLDARRIQSQLTTGEFVKAPITCRLTYRGRTLKPLRGGCRWTIPKALKKKRLTLTISARYRGETVSTTVLVTPR
jgi:hypothetical protein